MKYRVVCVREFVGMTSSGKINTDVQLPKKDSIYTCVGERFDGMGMHSLLLAELSYRGGYNSEYFVPVDDIGERSNRVEQPVEMNLY